jgi:hypothetical protein
MTQLDLFAPAQRHSATSVAAAASMQPHLGAAQVRVLETIREHGPLTDNEGIAITQMFNGYRARRIELLKAGLIREAGTKSLAKRPCCGRPPNPAARSHLMLTLPELIHGPEHVSPRRGIKRSKNVSDYQREAERALKERWQCKRYDRPVRCPICGTKNTFRQASGCCLGCAMKERKA